MKTFGKILIVLLTVALICCGIMLTVSADNATEVGTATDFRNAWQNSSVSSIRLTADIDLGGLADCAPPNRDLVVDLNGYTITNTAPATVNGFLQAGYNFAGTELNVTLKNGTISADARILAVNSYGAQNPTVNVILEDINIDNAGGYHLTLTDAGTATSSCSTEALAMIYVRARKDSSGTSANVNLILKGDVNFTTNTITKNGIINVVDDNTSDEYKPTLILDGANVTVSVGNEYKAVLDAWINGNFDPSCPFIMAESGVNVVVKNESTFSSSYSPFLKTAGNGIKVDAKDSTFIMGGVSTMTGNQNDEKYLYAVINNTNNKDINAVFTDCTIQGNKYVFLGPWQYPPSAVTPNGGADNNGYVELNNCDVSMVSGAISDNSAIFYFAIHGKMVGGSVKGYTYFGEGNNPWDPTNHKGVLITGPVSSDKVHLGNEGPGTDDGSGRTFRQHTIDADLTTEGLQDTFGMIGTINTTTHELEGGLVLGATSSTVYTGVENFQGLNAVHNGYPHYDNGNTGVQWTIGAIDTNKYLNVNIPQFSGANANGGYIDFPYNGYLNNPNPADITGKLVNDQSMYSIDFDLAMTGSNWPKMFVQLVQRYVDVTETKNADGSVTQMGNVNGGAIGKNFEIEEDGSLFFNGSKVYQLPTIANEWVHVTLVIDVDGENINNSTRHLFIDGKLVASGSAFDVPNGKSYPTSLPDWNGNTRTYASTYIDSLRFFTYQGVTEGNGGAFGLDNVVFKSESDPAKDDIAEAITSGELFASDTAILDYTYAYPAPAAAVADLGGKSFYKESFLQGYLKNAAANSLDGETITLYADVDDLVINSELIVRPGDYTFTYYSANYYAKYNKVLKRYAFALATEEDKATVTFKGANGETIGTVTEIIGNTINPASYNVESGSENNNWYKVNYGWNVNRLTVSKDEALNVVTVDAANATFEENLSGLKYNLSTSSYFTFNVFVPVPTGVAQTVVFEGAETVYIGGRAYYQISSNERVAADSIADQVTVTINYTVNGQELSKVVTLDLATYFNAAVADVTLSEEAKAVIYSAINYCNELCMLKNGYYNNDYTALLAGNESYVVTPDDQQISAHAAQVMTYAEYAALTGDDKAAADAKISEGKLFVNDERFDQYIIMAALMYWPDTLAPVYSFAALSEAFAADSRVPEYGNVSNANPNRVSMYSWSESGQISRCEAMDDGETVIFYQSTSYTRGGTTNPDSWAPVYTLCTGYTRLNLNWYDPTDSAAREDGVVINVGYYNLATAIYNLEEMGEDATLARALYGFSLATKAYRDATAANN